MKRILALLLVLPSAALAFDLAEDDTRHLSDPAYLPADGQLAADLDYQRSIRRINFPGHFPGDANEVERIQSNRGALAVAFGITDRLSVDFALRYDEGADKLQISSFPYRFGIIVPANQDSVRFGGVEDPTFGAAYRLLDQAGTGVNLDLHAAYSPYLARRQYNFYLKPYVETDARGRQAFDARLSLSRVMRSLTVAAEIGERHESGGGAYYRGAEPAYPLGRQDTLDAALKTQVRILDRLALDAAVAVAKPSALTYREGPYGPGDKVKYSAVTSASFGADYFLIPDRLYVGPRLEFVSGGPAKDFYGPYLVSEIRSPFEKTFGVRLGFTL